MKIIDAQSWSVKLPDDWQIEEDSACVSAWQADGVGALQFSAARKDGLVTDNDLYEFAEDYSQHGTPLPHVIPGEFSGFQICYEDHETQWRAWFLRSGSLALFVTYNCDVVNAGIDDKTVDAVLINFKRRR